MVRYRLIESFQNFLFENYQKYSPQGNGNKSCLYILFVCFEMWFLTVEWDTTSRPYCWWDASSCLYCWLWNGIQPHVHTARGMHLPVCIVDCGMGYNLTSILLVGCIFLFVLLTVERETPLTAKPSAAPSRLHCWRWKGIQPHVHTAGGGKGYTLTSTLLTVERDTASRPHCWWWNGINPHVYIAVHSKVHTLMLVERDTPSRPLYWFSRLNWYS